MSLAGHPLSALGYVQPPLPGRKTIAPDQQDFSVLPPNRLRCGSWPGWSPRQSQANRASPGNRARIPSKPRMGRRHIAQGAGRAGAARSGKPWEPSGDSQQAPDGAPAPSRAPPGLAGESLHVPGLDGMSLTGHPISALGYMQPPLPGRKTIAPVYGPPRLLAGPCARIMGASVLVFDNLEVNGGLVAPLVFKTSVGLNKVPGGFDSHSPPWGGVAGASFRLSGRRGRLFMLATGDKPVEWRPVQ